MGRRLPALMALHERHAALRDRFEILAFHNRSVRDLEELDGKMERIVERWGRELPFPVLLDSTGETYRNFSVRALGTSVLIGPDGTLLRGDSLETLEAALEALARPPGGKPE